jgi:hypothetical protein
VSHGKPALIQIVQSAASATTGLLRRVAIFGECAPALCASGHLDVAVELEAFGTELVNTMSVELMCAYPMMPANSGRLPDCALGARPAVNTPSPTTVRVQGQDVWPCLEPFMMPPGRRA